MKPRLQRYYQHCVSEDQIEGPFHAICVVHSCSAIAAAPQLRYGHASSAAEHWMAYISGRARLRPGIHGSNTLVSQQTGGHQDIQDRISYTTS